MNQEKQTLKAHNSIIAQALTATSPALTGTFVDFRSDYGFKLFMKEKESLMYFLNDLFEGEKVITDIEQIQNEEEGDSIDKRAVRYDLLCKDDKGGIFIIEIQNTKQEFFVDRAVFYTSKLISNLLEKGLIGNNYQLPEVYFIGIMDFRLNNYKKEQYVFNVSMFEEESKKLFYNKLKYKFIVLPHFNKQEHELKTFKDQWIYSMKNMSKMNKMSEYLDTRRFGRIFEKGTVANLSNDERMKYEASLKHLRDMKSSEYGARKEGLKEGRQETQEHVIKNMIEKLGLSDEQIVIATDATLDFVQKVRTELQQKNN